MAGEKVQHCRNMHFKCLSFIFLHPKSLQTGSTCFVVLQWQHAGAVFMFLRAKPFNSVAVEIILVLPDYWQNLRKFYLIWKGKQFVLILQKQWIKRPLVVDIIFCPIRWLYFSNCMQIYLGWLAAVINYLVSW